MMSQNNIYYKDLLDKYLSGDILESEVIELFSFLSGDKEKTEQLLGADNLEAFQQKLRENRELPAGKSERMHALLLSEIRKVKKLPAKNNLPVFRISVAAAMLILVIGAAFYFSTSDIKELTSQTTAVTDHPEIPAPSTIHATITLANGDKITLDSVSHGTIAVQGNVKVQKNENGEIIYQPASGEASGELQYNTIENPKGSKPVDMVLSDGTRVWLNAGSSMTFPLQFAQNERRVSMDGEIYFEVTHDVSKRFVVAKNEVTVQVLGTSFNVQAYNNEKTMEVTLLKGAVRVDMGKKNSLLKPGQQAQITADKIINREADIPNVMAWKNGVFKFDRTPLDVMMRQVERWYDVEVYYENGIPDIRLGGEIKRDLSLQQLLEGLGELGVHFDIKQKRLYVK